MIRGLLCEMAVYEESEVFQMNPIASVSTKDVINLEGEGLRKFVFEYINSSNTNPQVNISEHDIGVVISHHVSYRPLYKAALLALPNVMAANIVTKAWSRKTGNRGKSIKSQDNRLSGMVSAPILIDGTKYLCGVTLKKSSKRVVPYAIILKDSNGNPVEREKMDGTISNAPHRSNEPTTSGDARLDKAPTSHDTITSSTIENNPNQERFNDNQENNGIKDSINLRYNIIKENNQINCNKNMNTNSKNVVRLTESKLREMIKESVRQILREGKKVNNKPYKEYRKEYNINPNCREYNDIRQKQRLRSQNDSEMNSLGYDKNGNYDSNYSPTREKLYFIKQYGKFLTPEERRGKFTEETWEKLIDWENYGAPNQTRVGEYDGYDPYETFDVYDDDEGVRFGQVHLEDLKNF